MEIFYKEELVNKVYDLMDNSKEFLLIVSPYLNLWEKICKTLENLCKNNVKISIFTRDDNTDRNFLDLKFTLKQIGIDVYAVKQLHAKIFLNESKAIIGSINMTENAFSESEEIGGITNSEEEYNKIFEIINSCIKPKISTVENNLHRLENELNNDIKNKSLKISMQNNELIIDHDCYTICSYMDDDKIFLHQYNIYFDIKSEKKINWINKNIPKIKEVAYYLIFNREQETLRIYYTKPFFYSDIGSLLEDDFIEFENKVKYLIKAIEGFIYT